MNGHLDDEQWAAAALGQSAKATVDHLSECAACSEEVNSLTVALGGAREEIRRAVERPESFWSQQREGITTRLASRERHPPWKRLVWVAATVTLILLASAFLSRNIAPRLPATTHTDPDDALMLSVQQSIRSDLPQALRPAALLTQEIDRAAASQRNP